MTENKSRLLPFKKVTETRWEGHFTANDKGYVGVIESFQNTRRVEYTLAVHCGEVEAQLGDFSTLEEAKNAVRQLRTMMIG